jgi:hypothetical protein
LVDIVIEVEGAEFGYAVDARISESDLQKIAGKPLRTKLKGYWYVRVISGDGYLGRLCSGDHVGIDSGTKPVVAGGSRPDFLAIQGKRESFSDLEAFEGPLDRVKILHVVTDGGARPNPGAAGWGALIRQNGRCIWFSGHIERATNNAMEIRAAVETLRRLPHGMHVWISTDSMYVKMESRNGWVIGPITTGGREIVHRLRPGRWRRR